MVLPFVLGVSVGGPEGAHAHTALSATHSGYLGEAELLAGQLGSRLWVADLDLGGRDVVEYLEAHGRPIRYRHAAGEWPLEAYQNVYANEPGSAEMPSAGRPFTAEAITRLVARGVDVVPVVLHTGVSSLERGEPPYPERFEVSEAAAARINLARSLGGRVVAVGTTSVRAVESAADPDGQLRPASGWTHLVIGAERPPHAIEGVVSGFHDRNSSHLKLLESVAGATLLERAYASAREHGYLRHEFGDALLVLPGLQGVRSCNRAPSARLQDLTPSSFPQRLRRRLRELGRSGTGSGSGPG